jgi:poly-beta-1,6-N-acetyl-D-glucosamine synthase
MNRSAEGPSRPALHYAAAVALVLVGSLGLVAYTFLGYPAIVALLSRLRPKPLRTAAEFEPSVSFIVLAYNEETVIREKLSNTAELDYPEDKLEVIVVADGSDDATADVARQVPGTRVLYEPERRGKLAAMQRGARAANGELLVFSDANNDYSREAVRELAAPFADPGVGVVTGRKTIDDGSGRPLDRAEGLYWRYESRLKQWESAIGSVTAVAGEILAFRPEAFRSPPPGTMNEDFMQALLAALDGWRVVYVPQAVSVERASATMRDEATRRSRLVTGRWQALRMLVPQLAGRRPGLTWQVISHKGLRPLVPWALLSAAVSNLAIRRRGPWTRLLLAGQAVFYAAAALGWRNERRGRRNRLLFLPYYFCRMNAATVNGLRDFVRGSREAVWARVERG